MKGCIDGCMDGWASYFSLLGCFFTERSLRGGTSSLRNFFSEQPLIWLLLLFCSSAAKFFSLRSCSTAFSSLPAAIPLAPGITLVLLRVAVPAVLSQLVANPHSRSDVPDFVQRQQCGQDHANSIASIFSFFA